MNSTTPHLTLEELTGDTELSADARAHLAICGPCAAEAADWAAVASGTRLLVAGFRPEPDLLIELPGRRNRVHRMLPYAAAAAIVLGAGGYGLTSVFGGTGDRTGAWHPTTTGLIVTGCAHVMLASGTVTAVNGDDITLTPSSGNPVTVETSANTAFTRLAAGTTSDIADGDDVMVAGTLTGSLSAGGTLTATGVSITTAEPSVSVMAQGPGFDVAAGTVTDVTGSGFTLRARNGAQFSVVISASTPVVVEEQTTLSQLQVGEYTTAAGSDGSDGTLAANAVSQQSVPQSEWSKFQPITLKVPAGATGSNISASGGPGSTGPVSTQLPGGPSSPGPLSSGSVSSQLPGSPPSGSLFGTCQPSTLTMDYLVRGAS
jgi:hypothetical protein